MRAKIVVRSEAFESDVSDLWVQDWNQVNQIIKQGVSLKKAWVKAHTHMLYFSKQTAPVDTKADELAEGVAQIDGTEFAQDVANTRKTMCSQKARKIEVSVALKVITNERKVMHERLCNLSVKRGSQAQNVQGCRWKQILPTREAYMTKCWMFSERKRRM